MAKAINPFIVTGKIEPEYFCDRVQESARLIKSITNGNWKSQANLTMLAKQDLPTFGYNMIDPLKSW